MSRSATITMLSVEGIWRIINDRVPIVIYTGHSFLSPAKFGRCVPSAMKIKVSSVSPTLSVDSISIRMSLSSSISCYLGLPPPDRSVHFGIRAFWWRITVRVILRGINAMFCTGWLPHQPSHAFYDVSTLVYDRALVVVIPSHIFESKEFPLPKRL